MKRILLAHPRLAGSPGGGEGVAAWLIDGLLGAGRYRLDVACAVPPEFAMLDANFGTRLAAGASAITVHELPRFAQRLMGALRATGLRAAGLELSLLERWVGDLARTSGPYDLYISTNNELIFPAGAPTLSYIHYPRYDPERGETELHWYHDLPGSLSLYRAVCRRLSRFDPRRLDGTVAVANSRWTAERYRHVHGRAAAVVNPPVPAASDAVRPWSERANAIAMLGRLAPEKAVEAAVAIVERVRARMGPAAPTLHVIGTWGRDHAYNQRLRELFARHASWIRLSLGLPRARVDEELAACRFGLHRMYGEHFGMAVAEMQHFGCVPFVHASGGPPEIVGEEPRQIYAGDDEAVEKLTAVLADPAQQAELHARALARRGLFSTRRFLDDMLAQVDALL